LETNWRIGYEVELLAPPGKSRRDLADAIATRNGGCVRRFFHPQSEPSKVVGRPIFHNLTQGFEVLDADGNWLASCVDDLTLQDDLDKSASPKEGWYRVVSDDERLLRLVCAQSDPEADLGDVVQTIAGLFQTDVETGPQGLLKVVDSHGTSVILGAPLPGERERACELVTAPLDSDHEVKLDEYLGIAAELGFSVAAEGATHLHFDADRLQSPITMINLVRILAIYGESLKAYVGTNPRCRRLGTWPPSLLEAVHAPVACCANRASRTQSDQVLRFQSPQYALSLAAAKHAGDSHLAGKYGNARNSRLDSLVRGYPATELRERIVHSGRR